VGQFEALHPRFTVAIDENRAAGWRAHLNMVFLSVEAIGDIPKFRLSARYVPAPLNVLGIHATTTSDIRTDCRPADCATHRGDILPTSAADLVTEDPANDRAGDRPGNVRTTALLHLLTLDPATLFRWTDHGAYRSNVGFEQLFVVTPAVVISRRYRRYGRSGLRMRHSTQRADRRNPVIHYHLGERVILTRTQYDTLTTAD